MRGWLDDVVEMLADGEDQPATMPEVRMAVARDPNSRFQADQLPTTPPRWRAVQCHNYPMSAQMQDIVAV